MDSERAKDENFTEKCAERTGDLQTCMEAHREYYRDFLFDSEAAASAATAALASGSVDAGSNGSATAINGGGGGGASVSPSNGAAAGKDGASGGGNEANGADTGDDGAGKDDGALPIMSSAFVCSLHHHTHVPSLPTRSCCFPRLIDVLVDALIILSPCCSTFFRLGTDTLGVMLLPLCGRSPGRMSVLQPVRYYSPCARQLAIASQVASSQ